jgi:hypothetical protein
MDGHKSHFLPRTRGVTYLPNLRQIILVLEIEYIVIEISINTCKVKKSYGYTPTYSLVVLNIFSNSL